MKQVAVGIMMKDSRVLACQRRRTARYALKWEFPGGKLEAGESPAQALDRELREELSVELTRKEEFFHQDWVYPDGVSDTSEDGTFRVTYFLVHSFRGELVNHAFEQIQWVTTSELQSMDMLEGNKAAVEHLLAYVQNNDRPKR